MSDKHSHEQLDDLRERLYARGESPKRRPRTSLKSGPFEAPRSVIPPPRPPQVPPPLPPQPEQPSMFRRYRGKLVLLGLAFFALSIVASSLYILLGRNTVSGSNIALSVTGPFTVGGGEVLPLQVGVTNQNSVGIESATLVVSYPPGTRADDAENKELFSERIPIDSSISPGETRNVPLRARVFGEENEEEEVKVSIEYRMQGSSATFYKEAEPLRYKIGSSPVAVTVKAENPTSPGQESHIKITVASNSPAPIYNLSVKAEYPNGFDFVRSEPSPASGRDTWLISELKPKESAVIELDGVVNGTASEKKVVKFSIGLSGERNPNQLNSVLATADTEITIESPFLGVEVTIGGKSDDTVTIAPGAQTSVTLEVKNNSDAPVYDAEVNVKLSGNAIADSNITAPNGYYDSNTRTVRFNSGSASTLKKIDAGDSERFSFTLRPKSSNVQSPQIVLEVSANARRVSESSARESIAGTIKRTIKVEGKLALSGKVVDVTAGPTPPVVGKTTEYRIEWKVQNSGNNANGTVVTATLPDYVEWDNSGSGNGTWNYNPATHILEWRAGSAASGATVTGTFGVSLTPSATLAGKIPNIVENMELRADDAFTGTVLRASGNDITAEIDGQRDSGIVQDN